MMRTWFSILVFIVSSLTYNNSFAQLDEYVRVVQDEGENPVEYISKKLNNHDLIIFDDALHSAVEPFEFYTNLLSSEKFISHKPTIFLELIHTIDQPVIDKFLNSKFKDLTILRPAFQNDYSGFGLRYQTYVDLFSHVWDINHQVSENQQLKIIGVNQPIYWKAIDSRMDYDLFQKSLIARDYYMFSIIEDYLNRFSENRKGIFLTNTRHAYKHIRRSNGSLYWNTGTFFNQRYPEQTYSIRIDNVILHIDRVVENNSNTTSEGLEQYSYEWKLIDDGIWNKAINKNGVYPIAIPLKDNLFGKTGYVGNHMLDSFEGQTMYDAYDAVIFVTSPDKYRLSGTSDLIFTEHFEDELKRRIQILYENNIESFLNENNANSIDEFNDEFSDTTMHRRNPFISDEW